MGSKTFTIFQPFSLRPKVHFNDEPSDEERHVQGPGLPQPGPPRGPVHLHLPGPRGREDQAGIRRF